MMAHSVCFEAVVCINLPVVYLQANLDRVVEPKCDASKTNNLALASELSGSRFPDQGPENSTLQGFHNRFDLNILIKTLKTVHYKMIQNISGQINITSSDFLLSFRCQQKQSFSL